MLEPLMAWAKLAVEVVVEGVGVGAGVADEGER